MGLLDFLSNVKGPEEKEKEIEKKLFDEEADIWGLNEDEKKECRSIGISPEEWAQENDSEYHDSF